MSNLSIAQLESIDLAAGWPSADVPTAAAIEEAESSGDPDAIGPGGSWGTFQVQPQAHADIPQTSDPLQQAEDALSIFEAAGNSFQPWSTFTEGTYAQFLGDASAAFAGASAAAAPDTAGTTAPAATSSATPNPATDLGHGIAQAIQNGGADLGTMISRNLIAIAVAGAVTAVIVLEVRRGG